MSSNAALTVLTSYDFLNLIAPYMCFAQEGYKLLHLCKAIRRAGMSRLLLWVKCSRQIPRQIEWTITRETRYRRPSRGVDLDPYLCTELMFRVFEYAVCVHKIRYQPVAPLQAGPFNKWPNPGVEYLGWGLVAAKETTKADQEIENKYASRAERAKRPRLR